jgi:2-haloacid dehalogenase/putative hydrolase of the HAD superfamily
MFHEISREVESGSYELYAEVLRRTAVEMASAWGGRSSPRGPASCPTACTAGRPSARPTRTLVRFIKKFQTGLISNIDDKLLGQTRRHINQDYELVVTAQQVRSYKPDPAHFKEFARRIGGKKGWVHVASSYYHDVEPCLKDKVPVVWVNRHGEALEGRKKPDAEVSTLAEAAKLLGAAK